MSPDIKRTYVLCAGGRITPARRQDVVYYHSYVGVSMYSYMINPSQHSYSRYIQRLAENADVVDCVGQLDEDMRNSVRWYP